MMKRCKAVYEKKSFISSFGRAFKMMKRCICSTLIVLLVTELFTMFMQIS